MVLPVSHQESPGYVRPKHTRPKKSGCLHSFVSLGAFVLVGEEVEVADVVVLVSSRQPQKRPGVVQVVDDVEEDEMEEGVLVGGIVVNVGIEELAVAVLEG